MILLKQFVHKMIKNKTKKTLICKEVKILTTVLQKAIGLMFHRKINNIAYVFIFDIPRKIDLHMFFVFFPIDMIFLDKEKKVIEIKEGFKPFTVYYSKKEANYVVELPNKRIKEAKIELGDMIEF